jgi:hypothetical protein
VIITVSSMIGASLALVMSARYGGMTKPSIISSFTIFPLFLDSAITRQELYVEHSKFLLDNV